MANVLLTNYDYTYDGTLSTEIFIDPAVNAPEITSLFTVMSGIKYQVQLNIAAQLGKMVKGDQGCNQVVTGDPVNITNRTVQTCAMEYYLEQCADVFAGTILTELTRSGIDYYNLTGTQLGGLIDNLVRQNLTRELFRIFSFGDTTSPAGDPAYYNPCDGLWTRLFAGASSYAVTAVNSSISSLSAANTKSYFQALYESADILLKQIPVNEKKFYVTGNVYEALMDYYEGNANTGGFVGREEDGVMRLRYRGIDVIPFYAWDSWISADNLGNNVRILYTTPQNHIIGVEEPSGQGSFNFWYDQNSRMNKIDGRFRLGYNYLHDKLQAISYGDV